MSPVRNLRTFAELDDRDPRGISIRARLDAVLVDGSCVTLLDDRGWSGGRIEDSTVAEVELTARTVVGPDEPLASRAETAAQMAKGHRQALERKLLDAGVTITDLDLDTLPNHVELGPRLRKRLGVDLL